MDIEFHDHLYDDLLDEIQEWDMENNPENSGTKLEGDLDDDSFGEATDSCQPDHEFLEQILEEYHPERINLLDPTVPESVYNKKPRGSESSAVSNVAKTKEQLESEKPPSVNDASRISTRSIGANSNHDTRTKPNSKKAEESESSTDEDGDDAFQKSPQPKGKDRTKLFGTMGEENKRSLRTINGTFWSKPFKGLTQSVGGDGDSTGVTDS
jgi:hypothetical protein